MAVFSSYILVRMPRVVLSRLSLPGLEHVVAVPISVFIIQVNNNELQRNTEYCTTRLGAPYRTTVDATTRLLFYCRYFFSCS
jgi:hypothetical protein